MICTRETKPGDGRTWYKSQSRWNLAVMSCPSDGIARSLLRFGRLVQMSKLFDLANKLEKPSANHYYCKIYIECIDNVNCATDSPCTRPKTSKSTLTILSPAAMPPLWLAAAGDCEKWANKLNRAEQSHGCIMYGNLRSESYSKYLHVVVSGVTTYDDFFYCFMMVPQSSE